VSNLQQATDDIVTALRGTTPDAVHDGMGVPISDTEAAAVATLFGAVADFIEAVVPEGYDGAACIGGVLHGLAEVGDSIYLAGAIDTGDPASVAQALGHTSGLGGVL
jgi:hypothetical protein